MKPLQHIIGWLRNRNWSIISAMLSLAIIAAFLCYVIYSLPYVLTNNKGISSPVELAKAIEDIRRSILQTIGGAFALLALWYTARRVKVAEQSHITERYTKAIEQLGAVTPDNKPNIPVRLGAIYALERIAKDSPRDHWPIMEVLTAYVRYNSPAPIRPSDDYMYEHGMYDDDINPDDVSNIGIDIQAILTVIGRRQHDSGRESSNQKIDLTSCDLSKAVLCNANLRNISFRFSRFLFANFEDAHMEGSDMLGADMNGAQLHCSFFYGATGLDTRQFRLIWNWQSAHFDPDFRTQLETENRKYCTNLPAPEPPSNDVEG